MSLFLALDAGGTKTDYVLADESRELARVRCVEAVAAGFGTAVRRQVLRGGNGLEIEAVGALQALSAFHALLTQGHADSLMCSNLTEYQHFTADNAHGAADALNAGVDLDCGNTYAALQQSFDQHLVTEDTLNQSLHRLLLALFRLGLFDAADCLPYKAIEPSANDTPASRALALRAAEESIVLFKNDGTHPLSPAKRIAVIGPTADSVKILEANYHGTASHPVTPLLGLREAFKNITYAQGSLLAAGVYAPVLSAAFRPSTGPTAVQGLTAEFFAEPSFNGKPTLTITVPKIDLDLDRATPDPRITTPPYSARWTGAFVPPAPRCLFFRLNIERCWDCTAHDHFRLFLDDKLTLDNDGSKPEPNLFTLHATDTKPHALRIELFHTSEDAGIALVACRSDFVTTDATGWIGVLPLDRFGVGGVGLEIAFDLASQVCH